MMNTDPLIFQVNMFFCVSDLHTMVCSTIFYFHISPMVMLCLYMVVPTSSSLSVFPIHFLLLPNGFCIHRRKYGDIIMTASLWAEIWNCGISYMYRNASHWTMMYSLCVSCNVQIIIVLNSRSIWKVTPLTEAMNWHSSSQWNRVMNLSALLLCFQVGIPACGRYVGPNNLIKDQQALHMWNTNP
jgi:hypothetical protein